MTAYPATDATAPPRLRETRLADLQQVYELESVFFTDSLPPEKRRSLFVDNPLWPRLGERWPVGWVLEDAVGRVVGSLTNVPSAYLLDGQERLCANGHCWAVLPEHRGYAAMLMDEYFAQEQPDLLVSAKVGADATPVWSTYAERVPVGDWSRAAYAVTRYRGFARAALHRKGVPLPGVAAPPVALALRVKDALTRTALPEGPRSVEFAEAPAFDARFDTFWAELVEQNPTTLLGVRDAAALRWHYAIPQRAKRLTVLTASRGDRLRAYCVLKQHDRPGGLRTMKIVDVRLRAAQDARLRRRRPVPGHDAGLVVLLPHRRPDAAGAAGGPRHLGPVGVRRRLQLQVTPGPAPGILCVV